MRAFFAADERHGFPSHTFLRDSSRARVGPSMRFDPGASTRMGTMHVPFVAYLLVVGWRTIVQ